MSFLTQHGSLRDLARWMFLATLLVAPWFYGGTTALSIELIDGLLGLPLTFWVASLIVDRRWPLVPPALVAIALLILIQGWWMVINAHAIYDAPFGAFVWLRSIAPRLPGSADYVISLAWMLRATLLLGAIFLVAEMAQRPRWLVRLWYAIAAAGGSIALLGLFQKGTGAHMIFWQASDGSGFNTFFASFYYHANAGAFLNLVLPVVIGLVFWNVVRKAPPFAAAIWITTLLFVVIAVFSNTSRMAQLVGGLLFLATLVLVAKPTFRFIAPMEKRKLVFGVFLVGLTLFAIGQAAHLDQPFLRWQHFVREMPVDGRWQANRVALRAAGDAGLLGNGPGTFRVIFPYYQQFLGNQLTGAWRFLHDDYLQTLLEWGWIGSLTIAALFFGGIAFGARNYLRATGWSNRQRILLLCTLLALAGVALHAAVDFPLQILSIELFVATYLGVCWGSGGWECRKSKVESIKLE